MSSASGSGSSETLPAGSRGKKRRKKRNKTPTNKDAEETKINDERPLASKSASDNEDDSESLSSSSSSSSSESESDSESIVSLPPPLDGGWGWVVVIGSFFAHFLCDGLAYNAGIIYEHLHETFETGASETAWVSSVFLAVPYLLGPVAGAFTNRYGCRVATIVGAIIGFVGCVLSYFVDSLPMLCITFGVIFGLGQALVLFASSVIVPYYFEERRYLAYGLAVSGSGIGTATLAPLLNMLMHEYGWRGMMLILGGFSLNLAVCGALYRPLATREFKRRYRSKRNLEKFENMSRMSRESSLFVSGTPPLPVVSNVRCQDSDGGGDDMSASVTDKLLPPLAGHLKHSGEHLEIITEDLTVVDIPGNTLGSSPPAFTRSCDVVTFDNYYSGDWSSHMGGYGVDDGNTTAPVTNGIAALTSTLKHHNRRRRSKNPREVRLVPVAHRMPHTIAPLSRVDIFYRGSVNQHQANIAQSKANDMISSNHRVRALSCPHLVPLEPKKASWRDAASDFFTEVGTTMRSMASISILRRPIFIWFWLSNFLFYMWFEVPLNYIPEFATKLTGSNYSYVLVIFIGLVTCVGQIVFGYFCDKPWVSSLLLYGVGVAITGASTLFIPLISDFWGLSIYTAIFTFGSCGNTALDTIILTELLGIKRLTNSYGLLMVGQGLASLFGAPLAGYIIDMYESELQGYVVCFLHTGAWLLVSGVMIAAIAPCVKRVRRWNPCKREEDDDEEEEEEEEDEEDNSNHPTESISNRDLEAGGSSMSPSPDHRQRAVTIEVTGANGYAKKPGVKRVHRRSLTRNSSNALDRSSQASPSECVYTLTSSGSRSRSVSTSELNVFSSVVAATSLTLAPSGSVAAKNIKVGESLLRNGEVVHDTKKESGRLRSSLSNVCNDTSTSVADNNSQSAAALSESLSSAATTTTTAVGTSPTPTYAETAVGYVEYREGWADQVYKDRSLTVI